MSWTPISNTVPQYSRDASGTSAADYYIKFYADGTTTPISMATDNTGGTLLAKAKLDSLGYPVNASDDVFIPHIDQSYKLALFENEADADSNNLSNAAWVVDNLDPVLISGDAVKQFSTLTGASQSSLVIGELIQTAGYSVAGDGGHGLYRVVASGTGIDDGGEFINSDPSGSFQLNLIETEPNVKQWGARGDNSTDDTQSILSALNANLAASLKFPRGTYLTSDEIVIPFSNGSSTHIYGEERNASKIVLTGVSDKAVIRVSASNCTVEHLGIAGDATQTGNTGVRIAPEDESQIGTRVNQNYNLVENIDFSGTLDEGVTIKTGPDVGGPDSGAYHNIIRKMRFDGDIDIGIRLADSNTPDGSPSNRNWIQQCYFAGAMNVGVWNEAADTTMILQCSFEGVDHGTSPKASATAVVVENNAPVTGKNNRAVTILDCRFENNTLDIENNNVRTQILGGDHDRAKCVFAAEGGADPLYVMGGYDYSLSTYKLPGYKYQTNSQEAGIPNSAPVFDNGIYLLSSETRLDRYREIDFSSDLYISDDSDSPSEGQTYVRRVGKGTLIGSRFYYDIRIQMSSLGTLEPTQGVQVGGLPFTSLNEADYQSSAYCGAAGGLSIPGNTTLSGFMAPNAKNISMRKWDSTSGTSGLLISELGSSGTFLVSGSYEIESI